MLSVSDPNLWQSLYESPWQHPGVAFICGGLLTFCALVARTRGPARSPRAGKPWALLFLILQLEILLDAALTGALSPLPSGSFAATLVAGVFVVLGDLRYFYLFERQLDSVHEIRPKLESENQGSPWVALRRALPISLLLPLAATVATHLFPAQVSGSRMFLGYEVGFLGLASAHAWRRLHGQNPTGERIRYVRRLFFFELAQYALWALSDLLILTGHDLGWALRTVPNLLYYAAFVPVAVLTAPPQARP